MGGVSGEGRQLATGGTGYGAFPLVPRGHHVDDALETEVVVTGQHFGILVSAQTNWTLSFLFEFIHEGREGGGLQLDLLQEIVAGN